MRNLRSPLIQLVAITSLGLAAACGTGSAQGTASVGDPGITTAPALAAAPASEAGPVDQSVATTDLTDASDDGIDGSRAGTLAVGNGSCAVMPSRELTVTSLSVVEDASRTSWTGNTQDARDGAWTFGRLMAQMAGKTAPADFVGNWLMLWSRTQVVNNIAVPARAPGIARVIAGWPRSSDGKLDLTRAPMRLLAIVNRPDLRHATAGSAGELRFVYNVVDPQGRPTLFNVIIEYNVPVASGADVIAYAKTWHALGTLDGEAYNVALQAITDKIVAAGAAPQRNNGSNLNHLRTNEIALDTSASPAWELRQFEVGGQGLLVQTPVAMTPDSRLNRSRVFVDFVNANRPGILAGAYGVPQAFGNSLFNGGSSINIPFVGGPNPVMRPPALLPWQLSNPMISAWMGFGLADNRARTIVSVNTCNGCHGSETQTPFMHIFPRQQGQQAALSRFLTGEVVADPMFPFQVRHTYSDLQRRAQEFSAMICGGAVSNDGSGVVLVPR